jgi:hypothetical protein
MEPIGIALAIFIVLAAVTRAIANPLSAALVRARARRLPLQLRSRLEEEWLAELAAMPYFWERLLFAISLALSRQRSFAHPAEGTAETRTHPALAAAWTKGGHFLLELGIYFLPFLLIELPFKAAGLSTEIVFIFGACLPWGRWSRAGTGVGKPNWRLYLLKRILFVPLVPEVSRLFSSMGMVGLGWSFLFPFCFPAMPYLPSLPHLIRAKGTTNGRRIAALLKEFFLWVPFALVMTGIVHLLPAVTGFSEAALFKIHNVVVLSFMLILICSNLAMKKYRCAKLVSLVSSYKRLVGLNKQDAPAETKYS